MTARIEYLTRPGCSLCEEITPTVRLVASVLGITLSEIDIDRRPDLTAYGNRVPVLRSNHGEVLAEGVITRGAVVRALVVERLHIRRK